MLIGQLFDTVIFLTIAFYGEFPLFPAIIGQYLIKILVALLGAPLVSIFVALGRNYLRGKADQPLL